MAQIDFRVFSSTADAAHLQRLSNFFDSHMDDPFPTIQVRQGQDDSGRPIYVPLNEYIKEVQNVGHATQSS